MLLRVRFDDPGWFANSPPLRISCDGKPIYEGSFRGGGVASVDVAPGAHTIEAAIDIGLGIARKKTYTIDMPADSYRDSQAGLEAKLSYSRIWGNFTNKLELRRIDGER
jgi:hypothetical protein